MPIPTASSDIFDIRSFGISGGDPRMVELPDGRVFVVWSQQSHPSSEDRLSIQGQIFFPDGTRSGEQFIINDPSTTYEQTPSIALLDDGNVVVTWSTTGNSGLDFLIEAQKFGGSGEKLGDQITVFTNQVQYEIPNEPNVGALADGGFAITWEMQPDGGSRDVYLRVFNADTSARTDTAKITSSDLSIKLTAQFPNSNTNFFEEDSKPEVVGLADGTFILVWSDVTYVGVGTRTSSLKAQKFSSDGTALAPPVDLAISFADRFGSTVQKHDPSVIALEGGGIAVAWQSLSHGSITVVATYDEDLVATGNRTTVRYAPDESPFGTGIDVIRPSISELSDGKLVVGWHETNPDYDFGYQAAQILNSDLSPSSDAFLVDPNPDPRDAPGVVYALSNGVFWSLAGTEARVFDTRNEAQNIEGDGANNAILGTAFDDTLTGNAGDDALFGIAGANVIEGGAGDDLIAGGTGNDTVTGGAGEDVFVISLGMGQDIITDFTPGEDHLDLAALTPEDRDAAVVSYSEIGRTVTLGDGSSFLMAGVLANQIPIGLPKITGVPAEEDVLSADIVDIVDADGIEPLTVRYEWLRNSDVIADQTAAEYTLVQEDVGRTIQVRVTYEDTFKATEIVTSAPTQTIQNVDDEGLITIEIDGPLTQGQILTARESISDEDGVGRVYYQWYYGQDTEISGATGALYVLGQQDVDKRISVEVQYEDDFGGTGALQSRSSTFVANINDPVFGSVELWGAPQSGETLTADATAVSDIDGLGTFQYQWVRGTEDISGADGLAYVLGDDDIGSQVSVRVSYTDRYGAAESISSQKTSEIEGVNAPVSGDETADVLTGLPGNDRIDGLDGDDFILGGSGSDVLRGGNGDDTLIGDALPLSQVRDVADQVYRLYRSTLDRDPDGDGHLNWAAHLLSGEMDLQSVANGFVNSAEFQSRYGLLSNDLFIEQLYQNVLGRGSDVDGKQNWLNQMVNGTTREQVALGFSESLEFRNATQSDAARSAFAHTQSDWSDDVFRLYRATLERDPDLAGFKAWSARLATDSDLETVVSGFTNSREFQIKYGDLANDGFVEQLYRNVLDRASDAAGRQGWLEELDAGMSRAEVVIGFSQSQEFTLKTADALAEWMRAQGVNDRLEGGAGDNTLAGGLLSDVFVFRAGEAGSNQVLDLEPWDYLRFDGFGYANVNQVRDQMEQQGESVVFEDQGVLVELTHTDLSDISSDTFII